MIVNMFTQAALARHHDGDLALLGAHYESADAGMSHDDACGMDFSSKLLKRDEGCVGTRRYMGASAGLHEYRFWAK